MPEGQGELGEVSLVGSIAMSYGRKGKEWKKAKGSHRRKARSREKDKANQNPPSRWGQEIWSAAASSSTVVMQHCPGHCTTQALSNSRGCGRLRSWRTDFIRPSLGTTALNVTQCKLPMNLCVPYPASFQPHHSLGLSFSLL